MHERALAAGEEMVRRANQVVEAIRAGDFSRIWVLVDELEEQRADLVMALADLHEAREVS
jgi:hypothetical protein